MMELKKNKTISIIIITFHSYFQNIIIYNKRLSSSTDEEIRQNH